MQLSVIAGRQWHVAGLICAPWNLQGSGHLQQGFQQGWGVRSKDLGFIFRGVRKLSAYTQAQARYSRCAPTVRRMDWRILHSILHSILAHSLLSSTLLVL